MLQRARLATLGIVGAAVVLTAAPSGAQEPAAREPAATAVRAEAWILVDADTGAVLDAEQERVALPPASTIKLFTALVAIERLPVDEPVPISAKAEGMPARKINVKAGQVWDREDLLHSMLMVSANDAAVALAERVGGGTLEGYLPVAERAARRLGLEDAPALLDPSGLDDEFSNGGGSRISARDLAIVARAAIARPDLMAIATAERYDFRGGDDLDHTLNNHNRFLDLYDGATGLKTGLTDLAGRCFVGTATRGGRTMLVVLLDSPDIYVTAGQLLDRGFATPVGAQGGLERLPDVVPDASSGASSGAPVDGPVDLGLHAVPAPWLTSETGGGLDLNSFPVAMTLLLVGGAPALWVHLRLQRTADPRRPQGWAHEG